MNLKALKYNHKTIHKDEDTDTLYQLVFEMNAQTDVIERCTWEICEEMTENGAVWSEITDENKLLELDKAVNR
jgi:hypothetical protein